MTQAQNATREPTMEEILASIRRIIEDGNPPLTAEPEPESEEVREFRREFGEEAIADSLQHAGAMTALGQRIGAKNMAPIIDAAFYRDEADTADMAAKAPADEPDRIGDPRPLRRERRRTGFRRHRPAVPAGRGAGARARHRPCAFRDP